MQVEDKLDKLDENLGQINVTLAKLTESVIIHEKRSTALEEQVTLFKSDLESRIQPIQAHVVAVETSIKIGKWLVGVGFVPGMAAILKYLFMG